jgi:hypothetical protein
MSVKSRLILAGLLLMLWYTAVRIHMATAVSALARGDIPATAAVTDWKPDLKGNTTRDISFGNIFFTATARHARLVEAPDPNAIDVDPRNIRYSISAIGWVACVWGFFLSMMFVEAAVRLFTRKPPAYTPAAT